MQKKQFIKQCWKSAELIMYLHGISDIKLY